LLNFEIFQFEQVTHMKTIIKTEKVPIKLWVEDIELGAMTQAKNVANLPFAYHHVAIMPDAHYGYGMPIGGVLAAHNHVIPNAVGVDIGCGMCAVQTSLTDVETDILKKIMGAIRTLVPVGFKHHATPHKKYMPDYPVLPNGVVAREYKSASYQVGTLGGGNHFIEVQEGSDGFIWIMIHSGSRNLGKQVADYYNARARELNQKWGKALPKGYDLAFLPTEHNVGQDYLAEMNFCLEFAHANRGLILEFVKDAFRMHTDVSFLQEINIHHNYAVEEEHFGKAVYIHRKGATSARAGQLGIIPGSQGSASYIVKGKGSPESFMSCSHGAGRQMGRKQATRQLDFNAEVRRMNEAGILHSIRHARDLDEAPGAYKDIDSVMDNQQDLVDIAVSLRPRGVVKG